MEQRFVDRVVIVTGAGSGIGEATARRFAAEGASVVLVGNQRPKLDQLAGELEPQRTLVVRCDVSKPRQVDAMVASAVKRFGRLDVLVSNAGVAPEGSAAEASLQDWERTLAVNAGGVFHGARAALPHLVASRGSIINTASVSGLGGDWALACYNASKGAIINLTRSMALDFGAQGVRVNAVCPSLTFTPMTADMKGNRKLMAKFKERIPLARGAEPSEIASVIAFLASDDASFVHGVALPVDGGLTASNGQPSMG